MDRPILFSRQKIAGFLAEALKHGGTSFVGRIIHYTLRRAISQEVGKALYTEQNQR